jgi:hypothetical protein
MSQKNAVLNYLPLQQFNENLIINDTPIKIFFKDFLLFSISNLSFTFLNTYNCPIFFYKQYILKHKDFFSKQMFFGKVVHYIYELLIKDENYLIEFPFDKETIDERLEEYIEYLKPVIERAVQNVLDEYISIYVDKIYYSKDKIFKEKHNLTRTQILPLINKYFKSRKNSTLADDYILDISKNKYIQFNLVEFLEENILKDKETLKQFVKENISFEFIKFISECKKSEDLDIFVETNIIIPRNYIFLNTLKSSISIPDIIIVNRKTNSIYVVDLKITSRFKKHFLNKQLLWYIFNIVSNLKNENVVIRDHKGDYHKTTILDFLKLETVENIYGLGFSPKSNNFIILHKYNKKQFRKILDNFIKEILLPIRDVYSKSFREFGVKIFIDGNKNLKNFFNTFHIKDKKELAKEYNDFISFGRKNYMFRSDILEIVFEVNYENLSENYLKIFQLTNEFINDDKKLRWIEEHKESIKLKFEKYLDMLSKKYKNIIEEYILDFELRKNIYFNPFITTCNHCKIKNSCIKTIEDKNKSLIELLKNINEEN